MQRGLPRRHAGAGLALLRQGADQASRVSVRRSACEAERFVLEARRVDGAFLFSTWWPRSAEGLWDVPADLARALA